MEGLRKLGFTAYAKVDTDAIRVSLAILASGETVYVREDGSNNVLPVRPTRFLTCSHVGNVASKLGEAVNMAQMPWALVAGAHEWKESVTLRELATRKSYLGWSEAKVRQIKADLKASYQDMAADEDQIAA